nr:uncharacterized protein cbx7b isoform X1 [Nothobranchius furzeri]
MNYREIIDIFYVIFYIESINYKLKYVFGVFLLCLVSNSIIQFFLKHRKGLFTCNVSFAAANIIRLTPMVASLPSFISGQQRTLSPSAARSPLSDDAVPCAIQQVNSIVRVHGLTSNMARVISKIISPLLGNTDQHCKNSIELAKELKEITIEDNDILISHDVTSLFTKTPTQKTIDIVVNRMRQDKTLHKRTNLTADDIAQLIGLVANSTYFTYDDAIYKQLEGFAMGNPLSATLCEFFMEDLEQKAIATAPPNCKMKLWKRYVDDILEIIPKGQTETLTQHLNNIDDTGNIKFTYESETEGSIAFMDMKIARQTDGTLNINTYRKPTHTDQYLLWTSEHPTIHKMSVIRTLYHRANMVTEERDRKQENRHIQHALKTRHGQ